MYNNSPPSTFHTLFCYTEGMNPGKNNDAQNDQAALESIEHELYNPKAKNYNGDVHHVKSRRSLALPASWGDESPLIVKAQEGKSTLFGTKLLLFATLFFLIALGFSAWRVMSLRNVVSATNIDMTAVITPYIEGGELTPLTLTLRNRNTASLEEASVTLLYKQGSGSLDEQEKRQEKTKHMVGGYQNDIANSECVSESQYGL